MFYNTFYFSSNICTSMYKILILMLRHNHCPPHPVNNLKLGKLFPLTTKNCAIISWSISACMGLMFPHKNVVGFCHMHTSNTLIIRYRFTFQYTDFICVLFPVVPSSSVLQFRMFIFLCRIITITERNPFHGLHLENLHCHFILMLINNLFS